MQRVSARIAGVADASVSKVIPIDEGLPAAGKRVTVVCRQFRLLGYRDEKGIWREERRPAEELEDVMGWQELGWGE
jgi:hypothetical protein